MPDRLEGFETRLLDELKLVVAENAAPVTAPRRSRRRLLVAAGAGLAAVAAAAGVALTQQGAAYAVDRQPDGSVKVSVFDFRDPDGLRDRLAAYGIRADITYLGPGLACQEPRADYVPPDQMPHGLVDWDHPDADDTSFRIYPQAIGADQTLVYTVQLSKHEQRAALRLANGPVAPCIRTRGDVIPSHR